MNKPTRKTIFVVAAIILASLLIAAAIAASITIWSNTKSINPIPVTLTLKVNNPSPYVGEVIHFNVTLNTGVSGVTVHFYVDNATDSSWQAVTSSGGVAVWDYTVTSAAPFKVNATCTV